MAAVRVRVGGDGAECLQGCQVARGGAAVELVAGHTDVVGGCRPGDVDGPALIGRVVQRQAGQRRRGRRGVAVRDAVIREAHLVEPHVGVLVGAQQQAVGRGDRVLAAERDVVADSARRFERRPGVGGRGALRQRVGLRAGAGERVDDAELGPAGRVLAEQRPVVRGVAGDGFRVDEHADVACRVEAEGEHASLAGAA